ncbi:MAG: adenylate/guanylate cyclase domain-containing protein [Mariprofundales bacterium]|nr:adenylate/guanylate cyclase domain-containing protein [Mariprofundales bacterium]
MESKERVVRRPLRRKSQKERLRQLEVLLKISDLVSAKSSLDGVLETLVEITNQEIGAERSSLFVHDDQTDELYSRVAQGVFSREIRILDSAGVAGHVFQSNAGLIVDDAYTNDFFNAEVDQQTDFDTRSILCVPVRDGSGAILGVAQALNKIDGKFTEDDQDYLELMTSQAAMALKSAQFVERMEKVRQQEMKFLDLVSELTSEIELGVLLQKVMDEAQRMLTAERSSLFLNDENSNELWTEVGEGDNKTEIRFPNHLGIAGAVFTSSESVNIPYAYADLRFNPAFDRQTGFFTRSILCVPVINKNGKVIGVTQVLNKRGGPFTDEDESRLRAFTAQVAIGLENASMFSNIQKVKNYNESMLESMSNGVVTIDDEGVVVTCNSSALRIMHLERADQIVGVNAGEFFSGANSWVQERLVRVGETNKTELAMDHEIHFGDEAISVNMTILNLVAADNADLGTMLMIEDISGEKRVRATMARYMDPGIADQMLAGGAGAEMMGGVSKEATVLFSDIRSFTTLSETLGPQGTVALLNEYFTIMVDILQSEEGMLDKFIGDAMMAAFGLPVAHDDDPDRAVRTAIAMIEQLEAWNVPRERAGLIPVHIGIGLNTDSVVCGNIGSPKRMDYTLIGDGVNLAARLESACKQYAAKILISEYTYDKLHGTYRMRDIDSVIVKGKTKPVTIYEVLDFHSNESFPNLMEVVNYFREGRRAYIAGEWNKAVEYFKKALSYHPQDRLSQIYIDRCHHFQSEPPQGDWDGVWVMQSK